MLLIIAAGVIYTLLSFTCVVSFFKRSGPGDLSHEPVSVLKPVRGIDPDFRQNIESFCRQDYPEYEVLLGFTDPNDSALPVAREIAKKEERIRIVMTSQDLGVNKKIDNLQGLLDAARYHFVVMSDSDMRVGPHYLGTIMREYQENDSTGLVTSLYKVSNPVSVGAALESLTLSLDFIPSVLVARRIEGITFGLGASMLTTRKAIEDIGGLRPIADYLADDYQIGHRLYQKGYAVVLSKYLVEDVVGDMSISDFLRHQIRWARTYRASRPWGYLGYGITHVLPFSLLFLLVGGLNAVNVAVLGLVLALRFGLGVVMHVKVMGSRGWLKWLSLLPVKDLLSFGIWMMSFIGNKVRWRAREYRILKGGRIEEVRRNKRFFS